MPNATQNNWPRAGALQAVRAPCLAHVQPPLRNILPLGARLGLCARQPVRERDSCLVREAAWQWDAGHTQQAEGGTDAPCVPLEAIRHIPDGEQFYAVVGIEGDAEGLGDALHTVAAGRGSEAIPKP